MKIKSIMFLALLALTGCGDTTGFRTENLCPPADKGLRDFIIECAKVANPMSDEEGEDLVQQCEFTGERVMCPKVTYRVTYTWDGQEISRELMEAK